jgi:O-methyltransferase
MDRLTQYARATEVTDLAPTPEVLYDALKNHTVIPAQRFIENLRYAQWLQKQPNFPVGTIVECGVWRGGMTAGFMRVFGLQRPYLLFDSFQGLPAPTERDGEDALWWHAHPEHPRYFENCSANSSYVKTLLANDIEQGADVRIIEGWLSDTLHCTSIRPIAFVHLDCDWYDSTYECLARLWPHILPGGALIVDDYFDWEGCRRAVHDFLSAVRAREPVERVGTSGGACIRRRGPWDLSESPHLL